MTRLKHPESSRAMTAARMNALADYVANAQTILGLDDWKTTLKWDKRPGDGEAIAEMRTTKGRHIAQLLADEDLFDLTPEEQRVVVAHELTHLLVDPTESVVWDGKLEAVLGGPATMIFTGAYNAAAERVVDRIGHLLAELLPLPAFG